MPKRAAGRQQQARELRDACMLLAARHGSQRQMGSVPVMEVKGGPFTIRLTPSGERRELEVWAEGAGSADVLTLCWSANKLEIVRFRRGEWEQELLSLARPGVSAS
jgi:hypothetical protein